MKKLLIVLSLSLLSFVIYAQSGNYKEGYYITHANDTVYGLIDFGSDQKNAQECRFKLTESATEQVLTPKDINGYRFSNDGLYYKSKEIELNNVKRTLFLQYLVHGSMNLYYFVDADKLPYFVFEDENGKVVSVTKKKDKIIDSKVIKDNQYAGILRYSFQDYPSVVKDWEKLRLTQADMIDFAKKYHDEVCTTGENCIVYEEKNVDKLYLKVNFSLYGGMSFSKYKIGYFDADFTDTSPQIGGQVYFSFPRFSKSVSLLLDFSLSKIKVKNKQVENKYKRKVSYESMLYSGRLGGRYSFLNGKICPVIEGGFVYTYLPKEKIEIKYPIGFSSESSLQNSFWGIYLAAGVDYKVWKETAVFIRAVHDVYLSGESKAAKTSINDKFYNTSVSLGYKF